MTASGVARRCRTASPSKSPSTSRAMSFPSRAEDHALIVSSFRKVKKQMQTVSRVYDTYAQANQAVSDIEAAGVPSSEISLVANKYVSDKYENVETVSKAGA